MRLSRQACAGFGVGQIIALPPKSLVVDNKVIYRTRRSCPLYLLLRDTTVVSLTTSLTITGQNNSSRMDGSILFARWRQWPPDITPNEFWQSAVMLTDRERPKSRLLHKISAQLTDHFTAWSMRNQSSVVSFGSAWVWTIIFLSKWPTKVRNT